jgi:signal transduction histidine kinase
VHRRSWAYEALLVAGTGALQVYSAYAGGERDSSVPPDVLGVALLLVGPMALPLRRRAPLLVIATAVLAGAVYFPLGYPGAAVFLSILVVIGSMQRRRTADERQVLVAEQARRATEERLAIARDLHDVLAHSLSVVQVRAGVALHLLDDHPEQVRSALTAIKGASADGMRELRSAVGALRREGDAPARPLAPLAGLDDVTALVAGARSAGLAVRLERAGRDVELPPAVSLVGYRVVQEGLTNVVRHAQATWCDVRIETGERLVVSVQDDGRTGTADEAEGNGLRGMRERVSALGGVLTAGPLPAGGWRVTAELPL